MGQKAKQEGKLTLEECMAYKCCNPKDKLSEDELKVWREKHVTKARRSLLFDNLRIINELLELMHLFF